MEGQRTQNSGTNSGESPVKVPQPHGGALYSGGISGNKGGGRIAGEIRASLRQTLVDHGCGLIEDALAGRGEFRTSDRLRAFDIAGKYSLGEVHVAVSDEIMEILATVAVKFIPDRDLRIEFFQEVERLLLDGS